MLFTRLCGKVENKSPRQHDARAKQSAFYVLFLEDDGAVYNAEDQTGALHGNHIRNRGELNGVKMRYHAQGGCQPSEDDPCHIATFQVDSRLATIHAPPGNCPHGEGQGRHVFERSGG